ncbi:DUF4239 domain-containing protein [Legionella cincinnatiensis]|uniref:Integral membrane protein n=1 Tax=Legionella cincinnatiensis TaxID=28085 RepID=A0A378IFJ7_9GAMM|nr:DUF4239 domain-containing protein [Legionella cincinnatiensis]KTC92164.1 hypothetical protein Lcin_0943 [Legionella cincinnatiensis]STX33532.1 Uncharacterised protein [Legionella cincinnatiensis]
MLRQFIDLIPFWWVVCLCISFLVLTTLGAAFVSSRFFSIANDKDHLERSNSIIAILSGGFSVLLAFIIITAWNYLLKAQDNAAQEANSLAVMMRNIAVFPQENQIKLSEAIRNYTVAVRTDEWKSMERGKESPNAAKALKELYQNMQSFTPTAQLEKLYYTQALHHLNTVHKLRRDRVNQLNSVIPSRLSAALILGSIFLTLILGFIRGQSKFIDLIPIIVFAVVLGFNLAIAFSIDFPFSGDISVKNDFFYHGILNTFRD